MRRTVLARTPNGSRSTISLCHARRRQDLFSRKTLQGIAITHNFLITDHDGIRADNGFVVCSPFTRHFAEGFPPIGVYQLRTDGQPGDNSCSSAYPVSLYYRRTVVPSDGQLELTSCRFSSASWERRQTRLGQFLLGDRTTFRESSRMHSFAPKRASAGRAHPKRSPLKSRAFWPRRPLAFDPWWYMHRNGVCWSRQDRPFSSGARFADLRRDRSVPLSGLGSKEIAVP